MTNPHRTGRDCVEQKVLADINEYGWHATNIIEDDGQRPWTFSVGLYETWKHPELIVIGRSRSTAHEMLIAVVLVGGPNLWRRPSGFGRGIRRFPAAVGHSTIEFLPYRRRSARAVTMTR